jgi:CheY-like chemotaxis protein
MANILVVENNRCIVDLLEEILVSGGHIVTTAQGGLQASQILKKRSFDLAFIDLGLPDIDGLTLIRNLKASNNQTIPVVISGRADLGSAVDAFRAGARDYVLKPFDIEEILRIASEAVRENKQLSSEDNYRGSPDSGVSNQIVSAIFGQLIDPFIVVFSFLISLILQQVFLPFQETLSPVMIKKMLFLSICLGFCWGFIAQYIKDNKAGNKLKVWKDYSFRLAGAYLVFGTILFFVYPLANCRPAMFGSYALGLALLAINRLYIIPRLSNILSKKKEGNRKIVIVGSGQQAENMLADLQKQFGNSHVERIANPDSIDSIDNRNKKLLDMQAELHLEAGSLNHEEINHLIRDFGGNRVVINMPENEPETEKQLARV